MLRVIRVPVCVVGALVFTLLAYWLGLRAIEHLPAGYGILILLFVPTIGLVLLLLALPGPDGQTDDERASALAVRVRLHYKSGK